MKKALFIDRDGTIILEPPVDFQVDSLEKLAFREGSISAMKQLSKMDFELVMATNQDGLGTDAFPEETFWPAHNMMLEVLRSEGVEFDDQLIDRTFESENADTRKPRTGMFGKYLAAGEYDLANSYVIGDRVTDIILAKNLGAKGILIAEPAKGAEMLAAAGAEVETTCVLVTESWSDIAELIRHGERYVEIKRATKETKIEVTLDLDRTPDKVSKIATGLNFFDHMLDQISHHGGVALNVAVEGDLHVDEHHTIEDTAIVIGEAIDKALGSKAGIARYGFALPMDECSALVLLDFGGRIDFQWDVEFKREYVGDVPTEMFKHFFQSLCSAARCNLQIAAKGENEHHKIEGVFKAFARALKMAVKREPMSMEVPSSKGIL
ncbi:MAG: bifunctional histidinol-phosphatase/imidazoleglycerol-phosphate dehydratase HisB [Rikenellaceae bacterium]